MDNKIIHIQWDGPFDFQKVLTFSDEDIDYGIYQVYGLHPVYGLNKLLYIGKACQQTFSKRINQHEWDMEEYNEGQLLFYLGRLHGPQTPSITIWDEQIDLIEKLLIIAHSPALNSTGVSWLTAKTDKSLRNIHILNWGNRANLLPEISGDRWTDKWAMGDEYRPYSMS